MKKFRLLFLIALAFLFNTCKKENIEEELPELIGNWQFYGASYPMVCDVYRYGQVYNVDFIDSDLLPMDGSFKIEVKKRKIIFRYIGKEYLAFINKGNIQKDISLNNYYVNGEQVVLFSYMGYIPRIPTLSKAYYINDFTIRTELNYQQEKLSVNKETIFKKISVYFQGSKKEFLQVIISDIKGTMLVKNISEYPWLYYSCGGHKSMIVLTFEKI